MSPPRAFLLAAGLGLRLRPLTEKVPKPLVPAGGVPLVLYPLAVLRRAGVREVGINLHHLPERIPDRLGDGAALGFAIRYFREERLLGTGGAIRNAGEFLAGGPFLAMNADTILDLDVEALFEAHRRKKALATLALAPGASVEKFGGLSFDREGRVRGLVKPGEGAALGLSAGVYAGAAALEPGILAELARGGEAPCLLRQGVLPAIARGESAFVFENPGFFADVGTTAALEEAERRIRSGEAARLFRDASSLRDALATRRSRSPGRP